MEGLCLFVSERQAQNVRSDSFHISSLLFGIITKLRLYDEIIGSNVHLVKYAIEQFEKKAYLKVKTEEFSLIVEHYRLHKLNETQIFLGTFIDIPSVLCTEKMKCVECNAQLTFYNDRLPSVCTLYDQSKGSQMVIINSVKLNYIYIYRH